MPVVEISCIEVWREVSNFIEGEIEPGLRRRMEEHFKACNHCKAVLDGSQNVVALVGDGKAFDLPAGFSTKLKQKLDEHIRKSKT